MKWQDASSVRAAQAGSRTFYPATPKPICATDLSHQEGRKCKQDKSCTSIEIKFDLILSIQQSLLSQSLIATQFKISNGFFFYLVSALWRSSSFLASWARSSAIWVCSSAIWSFSSVESPSSLRRLFSNSWRPFSSFLRRSVSKQPEKPKLQNSSNSHTLWLLF